MGPQDTIEIEQLERDLETALKPVQPRTEFVGHLRQRLIYPSPEVADITRPRPVFWVITGALAGVLLTVSILGFLGVMRKQQKSDCPC